MFKSILVLCTGNVCRSPLAEVLLRGLALPGAEVGSAGTAAPVGRPADPLAVELAARAGFDLRGHRARQATPALLREADLILVMARDHAEWVHQRLPTLRGRVQLLGRWRDSAEVPDPLGGERAFFEQVFRQLEGCVADWQPRLQGMPAV